MSDPRQAFFIYPSLPPQLGAVLEATAGALQTSAVRASTWRSCDIAGRTIVNKILEKIHASDLVVADITQLNFNVVFEIGYTLGLGKRCTIVMNGALSPNKKEIAQLGAFDTLGYYEYVNSNQLISHILGLPDLAPLQIGSPEINSSAPVYLQDTLHKTDNSLRIASRLKRARIKYRTFDPLEQSRLSAPDTLSNVAQSIAVIVHLISADQTDHRLNNLRGAFLAGAALALEKELLILQEAGDIVPVDYREFVKTFKKPDEIDKYIGKLAPKVVSGLQAASGQTTRARAGLLAELFLGTPAAENEAASLEEYYVDTDQYRESLKGAARLVVARKGSGKTALFYRVRGEARNRPRSIVLDLKPESHQLLRFKQTILDLLQDAVREHMATAFWEYVLLLELGFAILETDATRHLRDHRIYESYNKLKALLQGDAELQGEPDFSERILLVVQRIKVALEGHAHAGSGNAADPPRSQRLVHLTPNEVTGVVHGHDIRALQAAISEHVHKDRQVWMLFDNLDKGWPTHGVQPTDTLILRALLEATRKLERNLRKTQVESHFLVFVRNDVYELLVDRSPDRGKEERISLDWTDPDLLREFLKRRIGYRNQVIGDSFDSVWSHIAMSHVEGEESSQYLIERSLMRPRYLLTLLNHCRSIAVNMSHERIMDTDILVACKAYSSDLASEIGLELRDVYPKADDLLYNFLGVRSRISLNDLRSLVKNAKLPVADIDGLVGLLLWFAFLGVVRSSSDETYIYDVYYDMKKLRALMRSANDDDPIFCVHRAFWPFLEISE